MSRGKYIVIEGHDGTGKTTQRDMLAKKLEAVGITVKAIKEPGETPIGQELRKIIKDGSFQRNALTNLLLFTADRNETWEQVILPALNGGSWLISDRNWYSTWVYQGSEGFDRKEIERITREILQEYSNPDLAFVMYADAKNRAERIQTRGIEANDTFEMKDTEFQDRVHKGYYDLASELKIHAIETSNRTPEDINHEIWEEVKKHL
jgi:dTMP kinase